MALNLPSSLDITQDALSNIQSNFSESSSQVIVNFMEEFYKKRDKGREMPQFLGF